MKRPLKFCIEEIPLNRKDIDDLENAELKAQEETKKIMEEAWVIEPIIKGFFLDTVLELETDNKKVFHSPFNK
jgi:hypothetical protein